MTGPLRFLDRVVVAALRAGRWLVLPVALLLFLQWPLRDAIGRWSREANDLGQWVFALYVAVAVTAATRAGRHLGADLFTRRLGDAARRRIAVAGLLLGPVPWASFVIFTAWRPTWRSILGLERFQDTDDPGYFLIRVALLLAVGLILAQAAVDLGTRGRR